MHFGLPPRFNPTCASSSSTSRPSSSPQRAHRGGPRRRRQGGDGPAERGARGRAVAVPGRDRLVAALERRRSRENAAAVEAMAADDSEPMNYYRAFRDIKEAIPRNAIIVSEGANTMDIGRTQLPSRAPHPPRRRQLRHDGRRARLRRRRRGRAAGPARRRGRGDSAFGFSGMEIETICRYNLPITTSCSTTVASGAASRTGPDGPVPPSALTHGARYEKMCEAFGGRGTTWSTRPICGRRSTRRYRRAGRRSSTC